MPKIQNFGMNAFHQASTVHQGGSLPKGGGGAGKSLHAGGAGGGLGLGASFGGSGDGGSGDPVINGNFEQAKRLRIYGIPIGEEQLSERGKQQQAQSQQIQKFVGDYGDLVQNGASPKDAFLGAVRSNGGASILTTLAMHPTALRSIDHLTALLSPDTSHDPIYGNPDPQTGRQPLIDPTNHQITGYADAPPGFTPPPGAMIKTDKGLAKLNPDGTVSPVTWSNGQQIPSGPSGGGGVIAGGGSPGGQQVGLPLTAAQQAAAAAANAPKTAYTDEPIPSGGSGKHPLPASEVSYLSNAANYINDLKVARDFADASGPVSGAVGYASGKYFGLNDQGAAYAQALTRLDQGVYAQYGVKGAASTKELMKTLPTHTEAPSYVKASLSGMITEAQSQLQSRSDLAEQRTQAPLPGTLKTQLAGVDVYPLTAQANASDTWVLRNAPDKLSGQQINNLAHAPQLEPVEVDALNRRLDKEEQTRAADGAKAAITSAAQQARGQAQAEDQAAWDRVKPGASGGDQDVSAGEGTGSDGSDGTASQQSQGQQPPATPMPDSRGTAYSPVGEKEATQPGASTPPAQQPQPGDQDFSAGEQALPNAVPGNAQAAPSPSAPVIGPGANAQPANPAMNPYAQAVVDAMGGGT
jgi:hypothetical protein